MVYHVLNRGNGRLRLFHEEDDYDAFERVLVEGLKRYPVDLLTHCLMPNHRHLVVRPRTDVALGRLMGWVVTITNATIVDEKYYSRSGITDGTPAALWTERPFHTYFFQLDDGTFRIAGRQELIWNRKYPIKTSRLQILPRVLRVDPERYWRYPHEVRWRLFKMLDRFRDVWDRIRGDDSRDQGQCRVVSR
jgi:REP element-mobilizing transposase RayT